ncbi:MAG: radical SAM protein, partial [Methanobacteriota archaeon]
MRKIPKRRFLEVASYIARNKLAGEVTYPFYASFKLTRRCNFTCSFCNCWHIKNRWKDMPTEDVKKVLDNIGRSSVIVCSFEGGDPLVRDDIGELLKYQYEKPWYLLFTTSERDLQHRYPMAEYGKYIDFLHISIDEGHKNLDMFDELEEYTKWGSIVTIQIVVTKNDVGALEQKIKRCHDAGVKAVVMC